MLQGSSINYRGKSYRVQNVNGWAHIIVTTNGQRKRIGVSEINKPEETDCVFDYIFKGGFQNHPCPAMEYWIYRHRMGHKITTAQYKIKYNVEIRRYTKQPHSINQRTFI